ncbi:MAG TPA: DUF624 domain-containing protein [Spirochaetia bacterium]|nr:DUF624 domain-containing protein [Spirochaetia bacterium]
MGYDHIGMLMVMNILFVLASLPLITLPATIPMLSAAVSLIVGGEKPSLKEQWKKAGQYYLRGGLLLLCEIAITCILVVDFYILGVMKKNQPEIAYLILGFVLCFLLIWLLMQIYVLPFFFAENLSVFKTFKKSFFMVFDNFGLSVAFGLTMLGVVLVMVVSGVGPFVIMVSFLFLLQHLLFKNLSERYCEQQQSG